MIVIYFDTCALVKNFHTEKGTDIINFVLKNINCIFATSTLSIIEFVSTIRRKLKAHIINEEEYILCVESFIKLILDTFTIETIDNQLIDSLMVIDEHSLKSADSIHLSTANAFNERFNYLCEKFIFVTSDIELANAAKSDGFIVINPGVDNIKYAEFLFVK